MSHVEADSSDQVFSFGAFLLLRNQRELREGDARVKLGGRALDLLVALVDRAGEVVTRSELEAVVWPSTVVEETSLRAHISALRKALGGGQEGARFIANIPGRGYCFVATVVRVGAAVSTPVPTAWPALAHTSFGLRRESELPPRLTALVGCESALAALAGLLERHRLVSVVGPGGVGKTGVGIAAAEAARSRYAAGVVFIDLAAIMDPLHAAAAVEAALRTRPEAAQGRCLLLIDTCEHLVAMVAVLVERLLAELPGLCVLATSCEPLGARDEWVYRLAPLAFPREGCVTVHDALAFPAVRLFVERASAADDSFEPSDDAMPVVCAICRRLEGLPIAIELAAARIDTLGLAGLLASLDDPLRVLTRGRRTAPARHRSLKALLDRSRALLAPAEQAVLALLATLDGPFTLDAAWAAACGTATRPDDVVECLLNLGARSYVEIDVACDPPRYRLPAWVRVGLGWARGGNFGSGLRASRGGRPGAKLCLVDAVSARFLQEEIPQERD